MSGTASSGLARKQLIRGARFWLSLSFCGIPLQKASKCEKTFTTGSAHTEHTIPPSFLTTKLPGHANNVMTIHLCFSGLSPISLLTIGAPRPTSSLTTLMVFNEGNSAALFLHLSRSRRSIFSKQLARKTRKLRGGLVQKPWRSNDSNINLIFSAQHG